MRVTAHLVVSKGYGRAIIASQSIDEVLTHCEDHNQEHYGESYLSKPKQRAVVTVEFEVPDSVFERPPTQVVDATVIDEK